jgi:hypothetical protein
MFLLPLAGLMSFEIASVYPLFEMAGLYFNPPGGSARFRFLVPRPV